MGSLLNPARCRSELAKGETEGAWDGMRDDRGIEVPKKRVTIVEGSIPVIDKREEETRRCPHSIGINWTWPRNWTV
jgi:hypothetical protein